MEKVIKFFEDVTVALVLVLGITLIFFPEFVTRLDFIYIALMVFCFLNALGAGFLILVHDAITLVKKVLRRR